MSLHALRGEEPCSNFLWTAQEAQLILPAQDSLLKTLESLKLGSRDEYARCAHGPLHPAHEENEARRGLRNSLRHTLGDVPAQIHATWKLMLCDTILKCFGENVHFSSENSYELKG